MSNSWNSADIEFAVGYIAAIWCAKSFLRKTQLRLGYVELSLSYVELSLSWCQWLLRPRTKLCRHGGILARGKVMMTQIYLIPYDCRNNIKLVIDRAISWGWGNNFWQGSYSMHFLAVLHPIHSIDQLLQCTPGSPQETFRRHWEPQTAKIMERVTRYSFSHLTPIPLDPNRRCGCRL